MANILVNGKSIEFSGDIVVNIEGVRFVLNGKCVKISGDVDVDVKGVRFIVVDGCINNLVTTADVRIGGDFTATNVSVNDDFNM